MPPAVGHRGGELGHREGDEQDQHADQRPGDRDRDRAAVLQRLPVGREAAGEDADDRERDREVGEPAPAALQLLLVAELGEALLVGAQVSRSCSSAGPPRRKRFDRPSFARDNTRDRGRKSSAAGANLRSVRGTARPTSPRGLAGRSAAGSRPARTCSVPSRCSVITRAARVASRSRTAASSRRCWALEEAQHLAAGGRCSEIRSVIAPCASVIAAHEPRRAASLRRAPTCRRMSAWR